MMHKRNAFVEKFGAQLDEWNEQIDQFKARMDHAEDDIKIEYYKITELLQRKNDEARMKLHALKASSEEAWEDIATGADIAWVDIRKTFQEASSKFK